ncbi:hypothetical protein LOZ58_003826 [Ophidiomyces ophidiicola]|nr:hypothetical protein LOZ58_003826 [Ophidiomyces ophidiicola]
MRDSTEPNHLAAQLKLPHSQVNSPSICAPLEIVSPASAANPLQNSEDHTEPSRCSTPLQLLPFDNCNDTTGIAIPVTPQQDQRLGHGVSLHVPQKLLHPQPTSLSRQPSSPKLDSTQIYTSPSSVLPRRSRGLDFSRASTNLHHSTLAEASPDSSPVVGGRGVTIPQRRAGNGFGFVSPNNSLGHIWAAPSHADRNVVSGSVSSINMLESDSSTCSEDDDDASPLAGERCESIVTTPQANKTIHNLLNTMSPNSGSSSTGITKPSLMSFQRARYRSRTRHSSTSTSGHSSRPSPGPKSPPVAKNLETFPSGYISKEAIIADVKSRRESLSLGTSDLHLSDLSDDSDIRRASSSSVVAVVGGNSSPDITRRGVIRRAVTRRGNLLPKTKNFARIKATLMEEGAPIESEAKKEAEVIRQVRESDDTAASPLSSRLLASPLPLASDTEDRPAGGDVGNGIVSANFSQQASENSGGAQFWDSFDRRYQTPPPSTYNPRLASSETSIIKNPPGIETSCSSEADPILIQRRSLTPQTVLSQAASELSQRLNKRRRVDDLDLDLASFKRRAVSPGTSTQSSPSQTLAFSFPDHNQTGGQLPKAKFCATSAQNTTSAQPMKRVGLQGMTETNEGFMNMSID